MEYQWWCKRWCSTSALTEWSNPSNRRRSRHSRGGCSAPPTPGNRRWCGWRRAATAPRAARSGGALCSTASRRDANAAASPLASNACSRPTRAQWTWRHQSPCNQRLTRKRLPTAFIISFLFKSVAFYLSFSWFKWIFVLFCFFFSFFLMTWVKRKAINLRMASAILSRRLTLRWPERLCISALWRSIAIRTYVECILFRKSQRGSPKSKFNQS